MKKNKTIALLATAITLFSAASYIVIKPTQAEAVSVKKKSQNKTKKTNYGFLANFKIPKSWQGKWYSNNNQQLKNMEIHKKGFNTPWTGEYAELATPTKVKGTNKYLWQMGENWLSKHYNVLKHIGRVSTKQLNNKQWIVFSPIDEKSIKMGFAFILETKDLDGVKQEVMLEANPNTGEIYDQFFRSAELAQKYHDYHFADLNYHSVTVN